MLLSASTAFAATDDVAISEVNDEISIDEEVLAVDDADVLESSDDALIAEETLSAEESGNVVTNDTFYNYFDESGTLLETVTSNELTFEGDFSDVGVSYISIDKPITLTGNNAIFSGVTFVVMSNDVVIDGFTINMDQTDMYAITVSDVSNVVISNNNINFKALDGIDSYAVYADGVDNFKLLNNIITYVGTNGTVINNAVRVTGDLKRSTDVAVEGNVFDITLPSAAVGYDEYNSVSYTDGMSFFACDGLVVKDNNISLDYNEVVGSWDTIHVITIGNSNFDYEEYDYLGVCNDVHVTGNKINANGHSYIYGIYITSSEFEVSNNDVNITSDEHYVTAIGVDGPSSEGTVENNVINIEAPNMVFGIYSYPYMGPVTEVSYVNNTIIGNAYAACGMELVTDDPVISKNTIVLTGNHTTGIVANMKKDSIIDGNIIKSLGSNVGNASTGDQLIHPESTGISIKGEVLISNNDITSTAIGVNLILGGNIDLENNVINVKVEGDTDSYGIYAKEMDSLIAQGNNVTFIGATDGIKITNGVYIESINGTVLKNNNFDITIPSAAIPWFEVPPSSGNWVSAPISEGIVVADSSDVTFDGNVVNVDFSDVVGGYDTIYSVDFKDSDNAVISNNDITSNGNTYIYGIIITGDNFTIKDNNITSTGDYYANGIDVEGPATGVVEDNKIDVKAGTSAYAIYSGMNGADVKANYTGNEIKGDAYNVFGFSSGDVEANIADNNIDLTGNYTTGIAYRGSTLLVENNTISAKGSNVGEEDIWESFGVETIGVKVTKGVATIANNTINSTGDYAIKMVSNSISDNVLVSNGKNPINIEAGSNDVVSEGPELKTIIVVNDFSKQYGATSQFKITVLDENGNVVANKNVKVNVGGKTLSAKTDANGIAKFNIDLAVGSYNAKVIFEGDKVNGPKETASKIVVKKATTKLTAKAKTFKAKTKTKKYTITLKANGKALKKVKVTIKVGKKTYKATTNSKGKATFKITKLTKKGKYTAKVKFAGNKSYKAVTKKVKITVKK